MFKLGDKVVIVERAEYSVGTRHGHKVGSVGRIVGELDAGDYQVLVGGLTQWVPEEEVRLHKSERKPKNIKSPKDVIAYHITLEQAMKDDILLMAHLYHKGLSFRDVAKLTNVHERTVRRRFKKYGVPSRGKGGVL